MLYLLHQYRGLAAILVVLFHVERALYTQGIAGSQLSFFSFAGNIGICFFFALSGYLMMHVYRSYINNPKKIITFWVKRLIRIYPTYWVVFIGILPAWFYSNGFAFTSSEAWLNVLQSALLVANDSYPLVVAWSLSHEMLFYFLFGFLILQRWLGIGLLIIWGLVILFNNNHSDLLWRFLSNPINLFFFCGFVVASLQQYIKPNAIISLLCLLIGTLGMLGLMWAYGANQRLIYPLIQCAFFSALILYAGSNRSINRYAKRFKTGNLFGDASYSIYLSHYPIIALLNKLLPLGLELSPYFLLPVMTAICLTIGLLMHSWVEKPLMRYSKKFI